MRSWRHRLSALVVELLFAVTLVGTVFVVAPGKAAAVGPFDIKTTTSPSQVLPGQPFNFTVVATNFGETVPRWGISVSFPDKPLIKVLSSSSQDKGLFGVVYLPGQKVSSVTMGYDGSLTAGSRAPAVCPLAEVFRNTAWANGQQQFLVVRVTPLSGMSTVTALVRVSGFDRSGKIFNSPDPIFSSDLDQQGYPVEVHMVSVLVPTPTELHIVSVLVPTPTIPPSPTPSPTPPPAVTALPAPTSTLAPIAAVPVAPTPGTYPTAASDPRPAPSAGSGDSTMLPLLAVIVLAAAGISGAAIIATRRPSAHGPAAGSGPASYPSSSYPPSHPSTPWTSGPAGPSAANGAIPSGYEIVGSPKSGGMATVYKAYQPALGRHVAIKVLSPTLMSDPSFVHRFHEEARRTASLEHPNIVPIYDIGEANGSIFIAMRYIDGESLQELLERGPVLPLSRVVRIISQVADALDYAHGRGIIHRDVKPANIMVEAGDRATLTDFGIARVVGGTRLTQLGSVVGTPEYLSPEQAVGQEIDGRSDLYSLGIVLYEMVAGRTPFRAETPVAVIHAHIYTPPPPPMQYNSRIPPALAAVILKTIAKDRDQRYQTGQELAQALYRAVGTGAP